MAIDWIKDLGDWLVPFLSTIELNTQRTTC